MVVYFLYATMNIEHICFHFTCLHKVMQDKYYIMFDWKTCEVHFFTELCFQTLRAVVLEIH